MKTYQVSANGRVLGNINAENDMLETDVVATAKKELEIPDGVNVTVLCQMTDGTTRTAHVQEPREHGRI